MHSRSDYRLAAVVLCNLDTTQAMHELESSIEQSCRRIAKAWGWELLKIQGNKGWPDRLLLGPRGQHAFVEFKRPGEKPRPLQEHILSLLRQKGHTAVWVDNKRDFRKLLS